MELAEKTVLNMVSCEGQCYSMSDQELNFLISYSVLESIIPHLKSKHVK